MPGFSETCTAWDGQGDYTGRPDPVRAPDDDHATALADQLLSKMPAAFFERSGHSECSSRRCHCRYQDLVCRLPTAPKSSGDLCSKCPAGVQWPTRRDGAAVAWDQMSGALRGAQQRTGRMFVFGGSRTQTFIPLTDLRKPKMTLADLWIFDKETAAWASVLPKMLPSMTPPGGTPGAGAQVRAWTAEMSDSDLDDLITTFRWPLRRFNAAAAWVGSNGNFCIYGGMLWSSSGIWNGWHSTGAVRTHRGRTPPGPDPGQGQGQGHADRYQTRYRRLTSDAWCFAFQTVLPDPGLQAAGLSTEGCPLEQITDAIPIFSSIWFDLFLRAAARRPASTLQNHPDSVLEGELNTSTTVPASDLKKYETTYGINELSLPDVATALLSLGLAPPLEAPMDPWAGGSQNPGSRASSASWFVGNQPKGNTVVDRIWIFGGVGALTQTCAMLALFLLLLLLLLLLGPRSVEIGCSSTSRCHCRGATSNSPISSTVFGLKDLTSLNDLWVGEVIPTQQRGVCGD